VPLPALSARAPQRTGCAGDDRRAAPAATPVSVLSVQAVAKRFGERLVFSEVSFRLAQADRVGLVGPNGVGKTTLLRLAAGQSTPDAGNVALARGTRVGLPEQELPADAEGT